MSLLRKRSLGVVVIAMAIVVVSLILVYGPRQTRAYAAASPGPALVSSATLSNEEGGACYLITEDQEQLEPVTCANTACNSWCWEDGTHYNEGTFAKFKLPTPPDCTPYSGGCLTAPCN